MSEYPFVTEPMKHQYRGLNLLVRNKGVGGLLMEPGCGKTKVVIDYLGMLTMKYFSITAFVAAPLSAVDTWPDEVAKHLPPNIPRQVHVLDERMSGTDKVLWMREFREREPFIGLTLVVTNLDVFSQRHTLKGTKTVQTRWAMADAIRKVGFDCGVVDESHRIKGRDSNVSKVFKALSSAFPRRIIMTGTVAPHSPLDIWSQWRFLRPSRFGDKWNLFESRFAIMGGYKGKQVIGFQNLSDMRKMMAQDAIAVRKADALDLPPFTDQTHHVRLTPREAAAYEELEQDKIVALGDLTHISKNALTDWLGLRQLTSGFVTTESDTGDRETRILGESKKRYTIDLLKDLTHAGEKVVVFAHFRRDVTEIAEAAYKALKDVPVRFIHGGTPSSARREYRKMFLDHDGPMVIVAQMRTVSLAINEFVAARQAIFVSMSERRDDYIQARDRLHRRGQHHPVTYHHLVVPGTIDELIYKTHEQKGDLESFILDHAREKAAQ